MPDKSPFAVPVLPSTSKNGSALMMHCIGAIFPKYRAWRADKGGFRIGLATAVAEITLQPLRRFGTGQVVPRGDPVFRHSDCALCNGAEIMV